MRKYEDDVEEVPVIDFEDVSDEDKELEEWEETLDDLMRSPL